MECSHCRSFNSSAGSFGGEFEVVIQNVLLWMSVEVNHSNLVFNSLVVSNSVYVCPLFSVQRQVS